MHGLTSPYDCSDGSNDVRVTRTPTQIPTQALTNLGFRQILNCERLSHIDRCSARPARLGLFDHRDGRHDLSGCTESALKPVMLDERLLDRMKLAVALQSFDSGDFLTI